MLHRYWCWEEPDGRSFCVWAHFIDLEDTYVTLEVDNLGSGMVFHVPRTLFADKDQRVLDWLSMEWLGDCFDEPPDGLLPSDEGQLFSYSDADLPMGSPAVAAREEDMVDSRLAEDNGSDSGDAYHSNTEVMLVDPVPSSHQQQQQPPRAAAASTTSSPADLDNASDMRGQDHDVQNEDVHPYSTGDIRSRQKRRPEEDPGSPPRKILRQSTKEG